jgi:hypothetical protein
VGGGGRAFGAESASGQGAFGGYGNQQDFGSAGGGYGGGAVDPYEDFRSARGAGGEQGYSGSERYGSRGYVGISRGNYQGSSRNGPPHPDPDYHQWREEQIRKLDDDYDSWRNERYKKFSSDFDSWRKNRSGSASGAEPEKTAAGAAESDSASTTSQKK